MLLVFMIGIVWDYATHFAWYILTFKPSQHILNLL